MDSQLLEGVLRRFKLDVPPYDKTSSKGREEELARAVMRYLGERPQAMDNVQGIAEWWVMQQQFPVEADILQRVLEELADQGRLERVDSINGPLYRLRR